MNRLALFLILLCLPAVLPGCANHAKRVGPLRPLEEIAVVLDEHHAASFLETGDYCLVVGVRGRAVQLPPVSSSTEEDIQESLSIALESVGHEIHLPPDEYSFELAAGRREAATWHLSTSPGYKVVVTRATLHAGRVYCAVSNWSNPQSMGGSYGEFRPTIEDRGSVLEWARAHPGYDNAAGDWARVRSRQ